MNKTTIKTIAMTLSLTLGALAWAGPAAAADGHRTQQARGHGPVQMADGYGHDGHDDRGQGRHGHAPQPRKDWHRGGKVPGDYRGDRYTVRDWHDHGLSAPGRQQRWVSVNGDYVLMAITTGVILSIVANQ